MTTKNLIPRASGEGGIGITDVTWGYGYYDTGNFNKGLFVSGHNITQVIAETVTQGGLGGEWTRNGLNIYYNGGNVGIGTTSPTTGLDVIGRIKSDSITGNNGLGIASGGTGNLSLFHGSFGTTAELGITIASGGNVGIGTPNPLAQFVVRGGTDSTASSFEINCGNNSLLIEALQRGNSNNPSPIRYVGESHSFLGGTGGAGGSGNVGIGTTNPSKGIEIVNKQGILIRENQGGLGNQMPLISSSIADRLDQDDWGIAIKSVSETASNGYGIAFWTRNSFTGSSTEKFRIDRVGNVGIGTTNPVSPLHVFGQTNNLGGLMVAAAGTNIDSLRFWIDSSSTAHINRGGNQAISITSTRNVGIGTTNPGAKLDIAGTLLLNTTPTSSAWMLENGVNTLSVKEKLTSGTFASRVNFLQGGNVGIGTANPDAKLTVVGQGKFVRNSVNPCLSIQQLGSGPTALFMGGNVGIGTSNPLVQFVVRGGTDSTASSFEINCGNNSLLIEALQRGNSNNPSPIRYVGESHSFLGGTGGAGGSGNVGIGTTTTVNSAKLSVNGNLTSFVIHPAVDDLFDIGHPSYRYDDVRATNGTIQISDRNQKNTIADSDLGLDFVKRLSPKSYKFNEKTRTHYGLIAQDVETVLSDINKSSMDFAGFIIDDVSKKQDGSKLQYGLRYTEFISPLVKAIQEQQQLIEDLKSRIETLENK